VREVDEEFTHDWPNNLKGTGHSDVLVIDERIILE
jgi:hypothetical protein